MTLPLIAGLAFFLFTATILDGLRAALFDLSGGQVRRLEEQSPDVAEKAEIWLNKRLEYAFVIRALSFSCTAFYLTIAYHLIIINQAKIFAENWRYVHLFFVITTFIISKELLGTVWLGSFRWKLLKFTMPLINIMSRILYPYLNLVIRLTKRVNDDDELPENSQKASAEDEILSLVEKIQDNEELALEDDEKRMIKGIFNLDDTSVREIMTPRVDVASISVEESIDELREFFVSTTFSRIPVYKNNIDNIVGIAYAKDLLNRKKIDGLKTFETIIHPSICVPENKALDELLEEFQKNKIHFAVVQDEYGGTSGIVTIEDILEEIVGEIQDEYDDEEEEEFSKSSNGDFVLDARILISELNERLEHKLPEEDDYDTVGGYIYNEIGRIPGKGERIQLDNCYAVILDADDRRISKLKLVLNEQIIPTSA